MSTTTDNASATRNIAKLPAFQNATSRRDIAWSTDPRNFSRDYTGGTETPYVLRVSYMGRVGLDTFSVPVGLTSPDARRAFALGVATACNAIERIASAYVQRVAYRVEDGAYATEGADISRADVEYANFTVTGSAA